MNDPEDEFTTEEIQKMGELYAGVDLKAKRRHKLTIYDIECFKPDPETVSMVEAMRSIQATAWREIQKCLMLPNHLVTGNLNGPEK